MYDIDEINPCEECDEDPDTCNNDPTECLRTCLEDNYCAMRDAYD